jgi:hypothetical protein
MDSPWSTPWFFIKKKDGSLRLIQDYREVNKWTICDIYPIPRIEQIIEQLKDKKLFTKFDVQLGYHNIWIKEEDQWKAAFKTPYRLFQPNVMFFGLTNSPATFQWFMDWIFHSLKNKYPKEIFIYMDDILIAIGEDLTWHRQIVKEVLEVLRKESLFLKLSKCKFEQEKAEYLGILVEKGTICIDPTKRNGLKDWPRWFSTVKQVRSMLGVLGYQWLFIKGFAHIAKPLMHLLKKGQTFKWTDECTTALDKLINIVTSDRVLQRPDQEKPFKLEVDMSQFALGVILYQRDDKGKLRPVAYHSETFNKAERGYDIHDRELLVVVKGLENWRHLLLGAKHKVTVYTDHANLLYYRQPQKINRRVARYIPRLAEYNFKLIHKLGKYNKADHLSRWPDYDEGKEDNQDITVLKDELFICAIALNTLEELVLTAQKDQDNVMEEWQRLHPKIHKYNDHWLHKQALIVVENNDLRWEVMLCFHDHTLAGHPGIFKTYQLVAQDYWWP